jgi:hypothetical protein
MEGITYSDVESMLTVDREWYLTRLYKQLKKESDEIKKKPKGPPLRRRK